MVSGGDPENEEEDAKYACWGWLVEAGGGGRLGPPSQSK